LGAGDGGLVAGAELGTVCDVVGAGEKGVFAGGTGVGVAGGTVC
jgi:hypothetical protein